MNEQLGKMKKRLGEKRKYLESELAKVTKAESILSGNADEVIGMLVDLRERKPSNYGVLAHMVRKAIPLMQGSFNVRDIREEIIDMPDGQAFSKTAIATVLIKLKHEGYIKRISKGSGSIPHQYKKITDKLDEAINSL